MNALWKWFTDQLDRVPSVWGIPLLVVFGALVCLGILKLFGV